MILSPLGVRTSPAANTNFPGSDCLEDLSEESGLPSFSNTHRRKTMNMEFTGSACRIRKCAFDLLSIRDDFMDDDESWDLIGRDLQLKSTFLYCDFSRMISNAPNDQKKTLTELANKLFCSIDELDYAVKIQSISLSHERYNEAAAILQEVMEQMPPDT